VLRLLEGDLKLGAAARRLLLQQLGHRQAESARELLDQRQPRLALAILDQREHRRGPAHLRAEIGQGQPLGPPRVPEPLTEHGQV
jgi:hypothetical protein